MLLETAKDWLHFNKPEWQVVGGYLSPVSDGYGKKGLIAAAHRRKICEIAVETSDWIMVDPWESLKAVWNGKLRISPRCVSSLLCGVPLDE
jgi:nicotinamide mononucleotide adenylyltransferase